MKKILSIVLLLSGIAHATEKKSAPKMAKVEYVFRKASPQEAIASFNKAEISQLKSQKQTPTVIHEIKQYENYLASYEDAIRLENTYRSIDDLASENPGEAIKKINALLASSDVDSKDKTYLNGLLVNAKWNKKAIDNYNKSRNK